MITDKDLKSLNGLSKRLYSFSLILFILMIVLFTYTTYHNAYLSIHYASLFGLDFNATLELWSSEPELSRIYSGYEHQSLSRLNLAIINCGAAMLFLLQLIAVVSMRKRNQRILKTLLISGAITNEQVNV